MNKGKNRIAAAVELAAVLLITAAAFAWGDGPPWSSGAILPTAGSISSS